MITIDKITISPRNHSHPISQKFHISSRIIKQKNQEINVKERILIKIHINRRWGFQRLQTLKGIGPRRIDPTTATTKRRRGLQGDESKTV